MQSDVDRDETAGPLLFGRVDLQLWCAVSEYELEGMAQVCPAPEGLFGAAEALCYGGVKGDTCYVAEVALAVTVGAPVADDAYIRESGAPGVCAVSGILCGIGSVIAGGILWVIGSGRGCGFRGACGPGCACLHFVDEGGDFFRKTEAAGPVIARAEGVHHEAWRGVSGAIGEDAVDYFVDGAIASGYAKVLESLPPGLPCQVFRIAGPLSADELERGEVLSQGLFQACQLLAACVAGARVGHEKPFRCRCAHTERYPFGGI